MPRIVHPGKRNTMLLPFEADNEHLHKAADLKFLRRKQIQAAG